MAPAPPMTASHPLATDNGSDQAEAEEQMANGRTDVLEISITQAQEVCTSRASSGLLVVCDRSPHAPCGASAIVRHQATMFVQSHFDVIFVLLSKLRAVHTWWRSRGKCQGMKCVNQRRRVLRCEPAESIQLSPQCELVP
jgi:hypothetical protein